MYTVNTEMQNETSETKLGYNIISRAIYYGATLLRGTVPAGDTKYKGILQAWQTRRYGKGYGKGYSKGRRKA